VEKAQEIESYYYFEDIYGSMVSVKVETPSGHIQHVEKLEGVELTPEAWIVRLRYKVIHIPKELFFVINIRSR